MVKVLKTNQGKVLTLNGDVLTTTAIVPTGTLNITSNNIYDVTNYASANVNVSNGKYSLLEEIKDDNNNTVGVVSGFFTDANDVEYAVVCVDRSYYGEDKYWCSDNYTVVTNLPEFNSNLGMDHTPFLDKNTATFNTQKIIDFCTATGATSTAASYCRSLSFVIDGITYYGQLPNCMELVDIGSHCDVINITNPSRGFYYSIWSSTQKHGGEAWQFANSGYIYATNKTNDGLIIPVLEIPNQ